MDKHEDDIHNCTNERLAQMLREIARRHVGLDKEAIYEAAKRIEAKKV